VGCILRVVVVFLLLSVLFISSYSLTLEDSVKEVMDTNPVVQERLKNYRAVQQDLNIAESEYYPSLDFSASFGHNEAGLFKNDNSSDWEHKVRDVSYNNYETTLTLTQNLFDGFSTMNKVDYQESRILAAAYNYIEKTNDIAFKMVKAYLDVLKAHELIQTARQNVQIDQDIYTKVKDLYVSGLTTESEVKKIQSSLSLAKSNLTVQLNNTRDAEYAFRRILGRMPIVSQMQKPKFDIAMPDSQERAALYAINHNPSLLVSRYNIKGAQSLWKQNKKEFYPKVDLEISQKYNDQDRAFTGFNSPDDRFSAKLILNYNIFRGGADEASVQKQISKINQEIEIKRDLKRQVIEQLDLSWNAYEMIEKQLKDLRDYSKYSEATLELYKQEYDLGRRSLLDLLSSQNDVINSRAQIIKSEYDLLFAKYRVLDAMGLLPLAIVGDTKKFTKRVNLYINGDEAKEILDTLPVELDTDSDKIVDNEDLCDNSKLGFKIMPYGCQKTQNDLDNDGIYDKDDKCLSTPSGVSVSSDGCALDTDGDGVKDYADKCPATPQGYDVDNNGCAISVTISVNFGLNSVKIPKNLAAKIDKFAVFLKKNKKFKTKVVGYTSKNPNSNYDYNMKLSKKRAEAFKNELVKRGIDPKRIATDGEGYNYPIADNNASEDVKALNRRVELEIIKDDL
jgi:adhesin transport system outer membrane protein